MGLLKCGELRADQRQMLSLSFIWILEYPADHV